jgi:long-chain acyl-CoA synthetase
MHPNPEILRLFDLLNFGKMHHADKIAFCTRKGDAWIKTTFEEYAQQSDRVSQALISSGIKTGDNIATISRNRAEFNFVDMGIMQIGAVHVPLYATIDDQKLKAILIETACKIVFAGNEKIYRKVAALTLTIPTLEQVICFDEIPENETFEAFLQKNEGGFSKENLQQIKDRVFTDDIASITYISGSTTEVKGIVHSHADHIHNSLAIAKSTCITHEMNLLSLLPLAHSYERSINYCVQYLGATTWYNSNFKTLEQELQEIKPEVIFMVPFLMQKIFDLLASKLIPEIISDKSQLMELLQLASDNEAGIEVSAISDNNKLLIDKIFALFRQAMGGNIKMLYCGGAALNQNLRRFFDNCGMTCFEGYGLTEAGPVVAHNSPLMHKAGTVGKAVSDTQIKISDEGEVLVKSPSSLKGFYKNTSVESPVDGEGWLHTGDTGILDADGFLTLTGVSKRIFKLSNGIYTDPLTIEKKLESIAGLAKAFVTGINKDFLVAVLVPDFDSLRNILQNNIIQESNNITFLENSTIAEYLHDAMRQYNTLNRGTENQVKYIFTSDTWNTENQLLTVSGDLNRKALQLKYGSQIEEIYLSANKS